MKFKRLDWNKSKLIGKEELLHCSSFVATLYSTKNILNYIFLVFMISLEEGFEKGTKII